MKQEKAHMKPKKQEPVSGPINTDLAYGILAGHYVTYKIVAGGEEIWSKDSVVLNPRPVEPAGSVTHPLLGVGTLGSTTVHYWVDSAARKWVYNPTTPDVFGKQLP